ncbi:MAG: hypothetical protein LW875_07030 [Proteobacteria bacterium]|nr:hypothetical protein [Pseudomonadota bacterium]
MKTQTSKFAVVTVMVLMALTSACGKKSKDEGSVGQARTARETGFANLPRQAFNGSAPGAITTSDQYASTFQEAVKALVSATVNPNEVGQVSNRNGVILYGDVQLDGAGNATTQSKMMLEIRDSYVGQTGADGKVIEAIRISMALSTNPSQRSYVRNGQAELFFADQYGWIRLKGTYDGSWFQGSEVEFQNSTVYQGASQGSAPRGGYLGGFYVQTCGFFRCQ